MIKKILIIFTFISLHSLLFAEDSYQQEYLQTQAIIDGQLRAFLDGDAELAYSFAAPIIRLKFKNSQEFMTMVKNYYEPVFNPKQYYFIDAKYFEGSIYHNLQIISQENTSFLATYSLIKDGSEWKISGCALYPFKKESI
jgi:hypothetical protein